MFTAVKTYRYLAILLVVYSCASDPKKEYERKTIIGVCQENQGMVTYDAHVYSDSTFYQEGNGLVGYSSGEFSRKGDRVFFKTTSGAQNFCPEYIFDPKADSYRASGDCSSDPVVIQWLNQ